MKRIEHLRKIPARGDFYKKKLGHPAPQHHDQKMNEQCGLHITALARSSEDDEDDANREDTNDDDDDDDDVDVMMMMMMMIVMMMTNRRNP